MLPTAGHDARNHLMNRIDGVKSSVVASTERHLALPLRGLRCVILNERRTLTARRSGASAEHKLLNHYTYLLLADGNSSAAWAAFCRNSTRLISVALPGRLECRRHSRR